MSSKKLSEEIARLQKAHEAIELSDRFKAEIDLINANQGILQQIENLRLPEFNLPPLAFDNILKNQSKIFEAMKPVLQNYGHQIRLVTGNVEIFKDSNFGIGIDIFRQLARTFEAPNNIFNNITELYSSRVFENLALSFSNTDAIVKAVKDAANLSLNLSKEFRAFTDIAFPIDLNKEFLESYVGQTFKEVSESLAYAKNSDDVVERIERIINSRLADETQSGFISSQQIAIISILLTIIFGIPGFYSAYLAHLQYNDSKQSQEIQERSLASHEKTVEILSEILRRTVGEESSKKEILYKTQRFTKLKLSPSFKAKTIGFLPKNTIARVLTTNHKWILVESLNYYTGKAQYGWVSKKYLKLIK